MRKNYVYRPKPRPTPYTSDAFEYTDEEREFMVAIDRFKRDKHKPFPSCNDLLGVVRSLGYRRPEYP